MTRRRRAISRSQARASWSSCPTLYDVAPLGMAIAKDDKATSDMMVAALSELFKNGTYQRDSRQSTAWANTRSRSPISSTAWTRCGRMKKSRRWTARVRRRFPPRDVLRTTAMSVADPSETPAQSRGGSSPRRSRGRAAAALRHLGRDNRCAAGGLHGHSRLRQQSGFRVEHRCRLYLPSVDHAWSRQARCC